MQLFEPGFRPADSSARTIGRIRTSGHPDIEAAIDAALRAAELDVVDIEWEAVEPGLQAFAPIYCDEMWDVDHELVARNPDGVGPDIAAMVEATELFRPAAADARRALAEWKPAFSALFDRVELLALPTMPIFPPRIDAIGPDNMLATVIEITRNVAVFNAAGAPATAQPVPVAGGSLPASLQLVGPLGSEELLCATAQRVETAVRA
jgi:amidase